MRSRGGSILLCVTVSVFCIMAVQGCGVFSQQAPHDAYSPRSDPQPSPDTSKARKLPPANGVHTMPDSLPEPRDEGAPRQEPVN